MAVMEQPVEAGATTGSPNISPHSPTDRFEVMSRLPRSKRLETSWKKQVRRVGVERQIPEFVEDQQLGLCIERQALFEAALLMRLGEGGDQGRGGNEQHRVSFADGFAAERNGQRRLAHTGWTEQQQRVAVRSSDRPPDHESARDRARAGLRSRSR